MDELLRLLGSFDGKAVLVLGDLFLDEYLVGRPRRVSREAPVLILEFESRFVVPGGGSNPAGNIAALGAKALQVGVIGDDQPGEQLKQVLEENGVDVGGVVVDPGRPTTTKTRLVAAGFLQFPQQVVRLDKVDRSPISGEVEQAVVKHIDRLAPAVDAILLSDYKSGVLNDSVTGKALKIARKYGKPITVDSQGDLLKFSGFNLVKCNAQEAESFLGRELRTTADFGTALQELRSELGAETVVVTRGADGMSVMSGDGQHHHLPVANRSEVFDVTGAGDTVIALLTLALASGGTVLQAAHLANFAAGLVVRKLGNATTSQDELAAALRAGSVSAPGDERRSGAAKIAPLGELQKIRQALAGDGKKVVFTNGSFDLVHAGHVRYLQAARAMGDSLIVGLNSDRSVREYKGPDRPIIGQNDRAELLAALSCVDFVVIFDEPTAEETVRALRPDIYVKGGDYSLPESANRRKELPEATIVLGYGGQVEIVPLWEGYSTTALINRIATREQETKER